eukprot:CAMPEP_0173449766 /NCGR_PEP_ID=MMETSP1357-20121228/43373_1 /TAXON_ID=77926 /ORGANISM="Hemiselmis rufescens, Strain PCC563" /LENGTH=66 /DNA_ID=CAMNT_0014416381 /DNA_START=35 /DNA_END=232 /DNA_ORIENTATION=+
MDASRESVPEKICWICSRLWLDMVYISSLIVPSTPNTLSLLPASAKIRTAATKSSSIKSTFCSSQS